MFKKFLTLTLVVLGSLTLVACGNNTRTTAEILADITAAQEGIELASTTEEDLTLLTSGLNDVVITWSSSDEDIIAADGTVTRPAKTAGDKKVTLTATFTLEGQEMVKTFDVTVKAVTDLNDAEKVAADTMDLYIQGGATYVDLDLPTAGANGTTITWKSANTDYLSDTGEVTRPAIGADDVVVTITATVSLNGESDTKDFELLIKQGAPAYTIAEAKTAFNLETPTLGDGDLISIQGVVTGHVTEKYGGYYIYDGTGYIYVFLDSGDDLPAVGTNMLVEGGYTQYYGMPQIAKPGVQVETNGTIAVPAPVEVTVADIVGYGTSVDVNKFSQLIKITGTVVKDGEYYYLVDGDDKVELNEDSDMTLVIAEAGKVVTLTVTYHTYHGGHKNHQLNFTNNPDNIEVVVLADDVALAADLASLVTPDYASYDLALPTEGINGTTFGTWVSDNTAVYADGGVFVARGTEEVTVTFTTTATRGELSQEVTVTVKVLPAASTALEATALEDGEMVEVTGIVTGEFDKGYYLLSDGHYVYVYESGYLGEIANGDEVTVIGEMSTYGGLRQMKYTSFYVVSTGNSYTYDAVAGTVEGFVGGLYEDGMPVTITASVTLEGSYNNVYLSGQAGGKVVVYYNSNDYLLEDYEGKTITVTVVGYGDGTVAYVLDGSDVVVDATFDTTLIGQSLVDGIDLGSLENLAADITLPATAGDDTTAIVWTSSDETVITAAGVVTVQDTVTGTATLTATVTYNGTDYTRTFDVSVMAASDMTPITVADAKAESDGTEVIVKGVVFAFNYQGYAYIQDQDGTGIFVYKLSDSVVNLGDEVVLKATLGAYKDSRQLKDAVVLSTLSTDNAPVVNTTATAADLADQTTHAATENILYTIDLTVGTLADGSNTLFVGNGTDAFLQMYSSGNAIRDMLQDGDVVTVTFIPGQLSGTNTKIEVLSIAYSDAQLLAGAIVELNQFANPLTEDVTLPTALEDYNATITWATSDAAVITDAGVVTRPAIGAADATAVLTATITINSGTPTDQTYDVTVKAEQPAAQPDLFISEYIEGGGYNKAIEFYNPTDQAIDLTNYVLEYYSAGAEDATKTLDLTGTVPAGGTFTLVYVSGGNAAVQGMQDVADLIQDFTSHNGDDCYRLLNDGVEIDELGTWGDVDWGKDKTFVRNPGINMGNTTYDADEWTVSAKDTYTDLGSHTATAE